jgi:hypothetical protein
MVVTVRKGIALTRGYHSTDARPNAGTPALQNVADRRSVHQPERALVGDIGKHWPYVVRRPLRSMLLRLSRP